MTTDTRRYRYWIAIHGSSCALSRAPMRDPVVIPTPAQMFGFPESEEAAKAQQGCLTAPILDVAAFMKSLRPDIEAGRVLYRRPDTPDPQTQGETVWIDQEPEPSK